jgi:hypothetical protein
MLRKAHRLRVQNTYGSEDSANPATAQIRSYGGVETAVNASSAECGEDKGSISDGFASTDNPIRIRFQTEFHSAGKRHPHIPDRLFIQEGNSN